MSLQACLLGGSLLLSYLYYRPQVKTCLAMDIGSGDTKITVGSVDLKRNKVNEIFHQSFETVKLKADLASSKDGCLSEKIGDDLIRCIKGMKEKVKSLDPKSFVAVGTSVFRTAKKSQEFVDRIKAATGIEIKIIPQAEEGRIGFATAVAVSRKSQDKIVSWDSGSGSFQMTAMVNGKLEMYGAEFAFIPALKALFDLREQDFKSDASPNPVSEDEAMELIKTIRGKLPEVPLWLNQSGKEIVGFGGPTSIFASAAQATGKSIFSREDVMEAIHRLSGKTDGELSDFPRPDEVMIRLILCYATMEHCGFKQVSQYLSNGICEGILVSPDLRG